MAVFKDPPNPNRHFGGFLTELGAARTEIAALSLFHFRENRHNCQALAPNPKPQNPKTKKPRGLGLTLKSHGPLLSY